MFDSSYTRGQPATFPLNQVIPGWTEALQLMSEGSTYELYIPPELAYGQFGVPNSIEPNSVLSFKVDLIKVNAPAADAKSKRLFHISFCQKSA